MRSTRAALIDSGRVDKLGLPGLQDDRRPVIAGGVAILSAVFNALDIDDMAASPGALREGLLFDLLGRIRNEDVRDPAIRRLAERYHADLGQHGAGDVISGAEEARLISTFVLSVDAFAANSATNAPQAWSSTANRPADAQRFGPATWVPMTDALGNALTMADPFAYVTETGGRTAADELKGTPYGRPEDITFNRLANGRECVYCAVTSENRIIPIELVSNTTAVVRVFADFDTVNLATGSDVNPLQNDPYTSPGSGTVFNSPDNLEADHFGSIYIIDDAEPGDIWKAVDANRDGVAEAIGIFVSLGVGGAEPTGRFVDPNDPCRFLCAVQHPASGNDALWVFDTCPYGGSDVDLELRTGVNAVGTTGPGQFVKTARPFDALSFTVASPGRTFDLAPFAILVQIFPSAAAPTPFLPPLWINPFVPFFALAGGFSGGFQYLLSPGGSTTTLRVPVGLGGFSVIAQGLAISQQATLVMSHAHEIVFN